MRIDIWSDFACPFCYIGKRHLEMALRKVNIKEEVDLIFHSFELDPDAPLGMEASIHDVVAKKYGITIEKARMMNDSIIQAAHKVGLAYNFDDLKITNTFDAHRLSQYAKEKGRGTEFVEEIFKNYFIDSLLISDKEVLLKAIARIGLEEKEADRILEADTYSEMVRRDQRQAQELFITSVPFFIFDGKEAVNGAQPVDVFEEIIRKFQSE